MTDRRRLQISRMSNSHGLEEMDLLPAHTVFVITGFGSFCGVAENPTSALVRWLSNRYIVAEVVGFENCDEPKERPVSDGQEHTSVQGFSIHSVGVIKVSAKDVDAWIESIYVALRGKERVIFLHFGVDNKSTTVKLEKAAYNNATFRCPDERGWQPEQHQILPHLPLDECVRTSIDVEALHQKLLAKAFPVQISTDPGRFLCNWIYFKSLQFSSRYPNWQSLFIHVPPFQALDACNQQRFAVAAIEALAAMAAPAAYTNAMNDIESVDTKGVVIAPLQVALVTALAQP